MASISYRKGRTKPYRVFWTDRANGARRNKSFVKRKEVQAFIETLGASYNQLVQSHPTKAIEDALGRWYQLGTTTGRGGREPIERSTARQYASHKRILVERFGSIKLASLDEKICEDIRDTLLGEFSRAYSKKLFTSLKSALAQAKKDRLIPENPAGDVNILISQRQRNANKATIPDLAEVYALTVAVDELMASPNGTIRKAWKRYGPMIYTLLYSGMRPTELRGLPWKDVDFERGGVQISQDADEYNVIGALKTGASYRFIPLPSAVLGMLTAWQEHCPQGDDDLVFPNRLGKVESHANITNRGWYPLCRHAGLTQRDENGRERAKYRLYTLRHIKASLEIARNQSPKRIQEVMGHGDIKLTFDTYGHLFRDYDAHDDPNEIQKLINSVAQISPEDN